MLNKIQCRRLTASMVHRRRGHEEIDLPCCFFACKKCGFIDDLEIHHEVYPTTKWAILRAINEQKIYMLCHKDHRIIDGFNEDTIEKTNYSDEEIKPGTMVKMVGCFGIVHAVPIVKMGYPTI